VQISIAFLVALGAALVLVPLCRLAALRLGFVAAPRSDRWHQRPIALLGGVGIGVALFVPALALGGARQLGVLLLSAVVIFVMGLADDIWSLKPATKLVVEIGVASLFLFFGYRLNWVHSVTIDWMLTLVWVVGLTNAFNLLDNMDGLCAGIAVIAGGAFLISALPVTPLSPEFFQVRYLAGLIGAVVGFLVYNMYPASIFMGDSGSLLIGVSLAGLTLTLGRTMGGGRSVLSVVAVPVLVLLIPIFDTTLVTISRMLSNRPTSVGGRDHTSHRLVAIGLSERAAVALLWLLAAVGGGIGIALQRSETWWSIAAVLFLVAMTIFAIYLGGIRVYEHSDRAALERGGLTPIVVEFVYKRRVAEVLLDFVLVTVSYYAAYRLKFDFVEFAGNFARFQRSLPVVVTLQLLAFFVAGVYRGVWRHFSASDAVTIVRGTLAGGLVSAIAVSFLFEGGAPTVFVIYAVLLMLVVVGSRASFTVIADALQHRRQDGRRVMIYGAGDGGVVAVRELMNDAQHAVRIVGFVDDDPRKRRIRVRGYPVVGAFEKLGQLIAAGGIDVVVLTIRAIDAGRLEALQTLCAHHAVPLLRLSIGLTTLVEPGVPPASAPAAAGERGSLRLH
jgi:UDP-GlcNAc:undecaprenyl-phosphate GlcNAc-1-phosphate transferase